MQLTSDNLPLSRVTKSNLQSTANGHPAHGATGAEHSGVELRPILRAKVQLTANCPRTNSSPCAVNCKWEKLRIAKRGGEDGALSIVLDVGCDVGRQSPDSICDKSKSGAYRTVERVGEGNPLEGGLIEAVITGRSPLDAGARVPYPSR